MSGRKFILYFAWDRDQETSKDLGRLENRYPALFELRRRFWPGLEGLSNSEKFKQGISGFLDHIVLSDFEAFQKLVEEETGQRVAVYQRVEGSKTRLLSKEILDSCDTLIIVSLDHFDTLQTPQDSELEALNDFLARENSCLFICPHHAVGDTEDVQLKELERNHHNDPLVPAQQIIGGFARVLLKSMRIPIANIWGLHPARISTQEPAPLSKDEEADTLKILDGVTTFNNHDHLPHLQVDSTSNGTIRVLAKQKIDSSASTHPFVKAGNRTFNAFLWVPPVVGTSAGNIFVCDATLWSSAFGGQPSLRRFWKNIANL